MAQTNYDRVGTALDLLKEGLAPFVERELQRVHGKYWITKCTEGWPRELAWPEGEELPHLDVAVMLRLMWEQWNTAFGQTLGHTERSLVSELRETRNKWAHQEAFSSDDAYRALDSTERLLTAVSAPQADEVQRMKMDLLRLRVDEQARSERRRAATLPIEALATAELRPWREVVSPHKDVASGRYQQAEFAADLWQVHLGQGTDEYRHPGEFFRRTFLTESLKGLLTSAARRLTGQGGDPVVQLQTNFGGGKTHSMLALYHLFSGTPLAELGDVGAVLAAAGIKEVPKVRRVVLVGNKISPGNPVTKADGTVVRTLWGELAWQLGGKGAYNRVKADDERATSPGDVLRELMNEHGPCLILIDEWVAYARQLHDQADLPGGSFETHFTFAQALTEAAKAANKCLVVISLPASDMGGSPHVVADDSEVGGERGRQALTSLRNAVGRVEASWRPASAEEGFEIVRRRLFEPLTEQAQFKARDATAAKFYDLYHTQAQEFPNECHEPEYKQRLRAAYPIHPEIFDRLYSDWSTLIKFQRTRGVLRLMAAVIHCLWEKGDASPLILPAHIAIDDQRVQFELTRYLPDNWAPVIEKDVDGPNSLPLRLDGEVPNLGKYSACRRVARTVYLGSAPTTTAANRGLEDRRIRLGCVLPGEPPAVFGDALRRLATGATYLYQDGSRYWYATQPTVTKLAEDRAEELARQPEAVAMELEKRLRVNLRQRGDFARAHVLPKSGQDVPDDLDARLVVLGPEYPYAKTAGNAAETAARAILESRGSTPRFYRNTLVFLVVDQARLQDVDAALRRYLAWDSILRDRDSLDLSPHQVRQAEAQRDSADAAVSARLPEAYQWLLVPVQSKPELPVEWQAIKLTGSEALAVRASKKLRSDELLITNLAGSRLRMELDRIPLWRDNRVSVRQLAEDFARYVYLPRLQGTDVLVGAVRDGAALLTWEQDSFAYADSYDEAKGRYVGLKSGQQVHVTEDSSGLLVRPEAARAQIDAEAKKAGDADAKEPDSTKGGPGGGSITPPEVPQPPRDKVYTRFHGSVTLKPERVGLQASQVAEEVISHFAGVPGAVVMVTLEIHADLPNGIEERVVRIVTENARTLGFSDLGFEEE